jgi:hypothetical protein
VSYGRDGGPDVGEIRGCVYVPAGCTIAFVMIKKLKSGYRLYSRKKNPKTGKRRNLGTFPSLEAAKKHERDVQYFKRH